MNNKFLRTFLILLTVFVVQISGAYHYKPSSLTTAQNDWTTACTNLERNISYLENLDSKAGDIEVSIDVNNEELRDALLATPQYYSTDVISAWASALSAATLTGYDIYDGILLHKALSNVAGAINTQMDKVGTKYDSPEGSSYFAKRKKAYNDYVREINLYNAGHSGDDIGLPTQPETKHEVARRTPPPSVNFYACKGGCGDEGPREWSNTFMQYIGIPSHFVRHCQVVMHDDWKTYLVYGAPIKCGAAYYACEGRFICPNAHNHPGGGSGSVGVQVRASDHQHSHPHSSSAENPVASPTPTPTPPSPTYHACGVHETSVSGDHSLQASCSSTDSNGNSCTVTNFYACDAHTHSYPTSEYCWCGGVDYVTCDGCGATYHLCTSAKGGCPSSADGYHYRAN